MPIKPYISPITIPQHLHDRRISALIIEDDLSDIDTPNSTWFLPAGTFEYATDLHQKPVKAASPRTTTTKTTQNVKPGLLSLSLSSPPTAPDTSRRPSIALAKLQTENLERCNIHALSSSNSSNASPDSAKHFAKKPRRDSGVFFHSPLSRSYTLEQSYSSSGSSSPASRSPMSRRSASPVEPESPVFYPDSDDESVSPHSQPIAIPRKRRHAFVGKDAVEDDMRRSVSTRSWSNSEESDVESVFDRNDRFDIVVARRSYDQEEDEGSLEDWVDMVYSPSTPFSHALISEVVRRRRSDEKFAKLITNSSDPEAIQSAQFEESSRRSQWIREMESTYPIECGCGKWNGDEGCEC